MIVGISYLSLSVVSATTTFTGVGGFRNTRIEGSTLGPLARLSQVGLAFQTGHALTLDLVQVSQPQGGANQPTHAFDLALIYVPGEPPDNACGRLLR
jgi:hypothetical protein